MQGPRRNLHLQEAQRAQLFQEQKLFLQKLQKARSGIPTAAGLRAEELQAKVFAAKSTSRSSTELGSGTADRRSSGSESELFEICEDQEPVRAVAPSPVHEKVRSAALISKLEAHPERILHDDVVLELSCAVVSLTRDSRGCRLVQAVLDHGCQRQAAQLLAGLKGHISECSVSAHGNHVIQKAARIMPSFLASELVGRGSVMARHRYACRALCRLVEAAPEDECVQQLIEEVLAVDEVVQNCRSSFGHHVIQSILEHGLPRYRDVIASAMLQDPLANACHRHSIYVLESMILHCSSEVRAEVLRTLGPADSVQTMAQSQYGCYVVSALLQLEGFDSAGARQGLQEMMCELSSAKYGNRLLQDLGLTTA